MSHNIARKPVERARYSHASVQEEATLARPTSPSPRALPSAPPRSNYGLHTSEHESIIDHSQSTSIVGEDEFGEKPPVNTSQWKVEWQAPTVLTGSYLAALGAAVGHLVFFSKLNGTRVNEYYIPQSYVITISTQIATVWSFCLSACLSVAFTQILWDHLRDHFTSVGDIEKLHGLIGNFFLVRPRLMIAMPTLYITAFLSWSLSIIKTLPPGALTVDMTLYSNTTDIVVPSYNSSFVGNGSFLDIAAYTPGGMTVFFFSKDARMVLGSSSQDDLKRATTRYLITKELPNLLSPCGVNCSFVIEFEGPYLDCNSVILNTTTSTLNSMVPNQNTQIKYRFYDANHDSTGLNIKIFKPISIPVVIGNNSFVPQGDQTLVEVKQLTCRWATALYTANMTYINGIRNITYSTRPLGRLDWPKNCQDNYTNSAVRIDDPSCGSFMDGDGVLNDAGRKAAKALKNYGMIKYLVDVLTINIPQSCSLPDKVTSNVSALDCVLGLVDDYSAPFYNTFMFETSAVGYGMNTDLTPFADRLPKIHTSADELNAALFNMTMVYTYSYFNALETTVVATQNWLELTYVFSRPRNLILPYFIPLSLAMFALAYALMLMYCKNHVAAMGNSFEQVLVTTTGTKTLADVAAGGCLGGTNNIPKDLEELEIKYGDITESMDGVESTTAVRRAGFGVEGEVQPLRKRAVYGST